MPNKSLRRNPGWKLEPETIDIVSAARTALGKNAAQVIHGWAMAAGRVGRLNGDQAKTISPSPLAVLQDKPMAVRVETPYQIDRRARLEALRAQLAAGGGQAAVVEEFSGPDAPVLPFEVVLNGEKHRVIAFKGRRVLEWVGPTTNVMKKNLTPQETVIYWHQRVKG